MFVTKTITTLTLRPSETTRSKQTYLKALNGFCRDRSKRSNSKKKLTDESYKAKK